MEGWPDAPDWIAAAARDEGWGPNYCRALAQSFKDYKLELMRDRSRILVQHKGRFVRGVRVDPDARYAIRDALEAFLEQEREQARKEKRLAKAQKRVFGHDADETP